MPNSAEQLASDSTHLPYKVLPDALLDCLWRLEEVADMGEVLRRTTL